MLVFSYSFHKSKTDCFWVVKRGVCTICSRIGCFMGTKLPMNDRRIWYSRAEDFFQSKAFWNKILSVSKTLLVWSQIWSYLFSFFLMRSSRFQVAYSCLFFLTKCNFGLQNIMKDWVWRDYEDLDFECTFDLFANE